MGLNSREIVIRINDNINYITILQLKKKYKETESLKNKLSFD